MPTCNIVFDNNPNGIYYAGQLLSGVIKLDNEKKREIRGITLRIEGFATCKWTESEGTGKNRRTVYYSGREDYINSFSYLIGSFDTTKLIFHAGLHQFNFSCSLPPQLPTSLESKYGYIRYQVKVEMERPWKTDYNYCFAFTVIRNLDLNYESSSLRNPIKVEKTKQFFFGFASKGLYLSAEIPVTGYVSGQQISASINVNNESNVEVNEVAVELVKIVHYNSDMPRKKTKERREHVTVSQGSGVPVKSKASTNIHVIIPPVPPTNTGTCRVLSQFYEIHVIAKVGAFHRDVELRIPITIGTVPLFALNFNQTGLYPNLNAPQSMQIPPIMPQRPAPLAPAPQSSLSNYPQNSLSNHQQATPYQQPVPSSSYQFAPSEPQPYTPEEYDMPPPSYQEAMSLNSMEPDNEEGLNEQQPFNPQYPVFNFANYGIQPPHAQPVSQGFPTPLVNVPQFPPNQQKQKY